MFITLARTNRNLYVSSCPPRFTLGVPRNTPVLPVQSGVWNQRRTVYYNPSKTVTKQQANKDKLEQLKNNMNEALIKVHGLAEALIIDEEGKNRGVHKIQDALVAARQLKLDLILLNKNHTPPVAKLTRRTKFIQETAAGIKEKEKELLVSENISENDLQIKVTRIRLLLEKLHKIKVIFRYKSMRNQNRELCKAILSNVVSRVADIADTTRSTVSTEGREHYIIIWPNLKEIRRRQAEGIKEKSRKDIEMEEIIAKYETNRKTALEKIKKEEEKKEIEQILQRQLLEEIKAKENEIDEDEDEDEEEVKVKQTESKKDKKAARHAEKAQKAAAAAAKKKPVEEEEDDDFFDDEDEDEAEEDEEEWLGNMGKKNKKEKKQQQQQQQNKQQNKQQQQQQQQKQQQQQQQQKQQQQQQQKQQQQQANEIRRGNKSIPFGVVDPSQDLILEKILTGPRSPAVQQKYDDLERLSSDLAAYGEEEEWEEGEGEEEEVWEEIEDDEEDLDEDQMIQDILDKSKKKKNPNSEKPLRSRF